MKIDLSNLAAGLLLGASFSFFLPAIASTAKKSAVIEKTIANFVHSLKCHVVDVQDVDLWQGKVLVKAKNLNISFVMTAIDSTSYEICPVGIGVKKLPPPEKKK